MFEVEHVLQRTDKGEKENGEPAKTVRHKSKLRNGNALDTRRLMNGVNGAT